MGGSGQISERRAFLRSFLAHPRHVGAVLPTSRRTVRDMLDLADLDGARLVMELGAGTGVHTRELLARLGPDARLVAFEIDPDLAGGLAAGLEDPRLEVVAGSAEEIESHAGPGEVDVIVSALPFTSLPAPVRGRVLDAALRVLSPEGVMLVLQYSPLMRGELERAFGSVERRFSPINLPPAFLFRCTGPRPAGEAP
ncbi:MAG: methyltransferase domain-containing protein [Actinomycetota bacterium]|nr:methyltransferase domain-containing protein [Actinomycetota bacterium]